VSGTLSGGQSLAGWAFEADASNRGKQVSVQDPLFPLDPALPVVGFERNEPFRRLLGELGLELPAAHLDPGVVYHSKGRALVRPASVEGWIEAGHEWFSGAGWRAFWESVWNLSVAAWNFVDEFGTLPRRAPAGFPYLHPSMWQGFSRNRLLFSRASDYLTSFDIEPNEEFRRFVESQIRFAYGLGLEEVPLGLAALVLNAPSIAYSVERANKEPPHKPEPSKNPRSASTWRIGFLSGLGLRGLSTHQAFFQKGVDGLACQTVVLTLGKEPGGFLYFRSGAGNVEGLARALEGTLGKDWGQLTLDTRSPLSGLAYTVDGGNAQTVVEPEWPWLGPARAYLEVRRTLV